jgi:FkbM family methyltransferase
LSGVGNMIVRNVGIGNTSGLEGGRIAVRVLDLTETGHAWLDSASSNSSNFGGLSLLGCPAENVDVSPSFEADALVAECQATGKDTRGSHIWVDVVSLDSFGWHVGASPQCPRVIKIDVEGMETQVLAGGRGLLSRCRPVLHVENNVYSASKPLVDLLADLGYDMFWEIGVFSGSRNYYGYDFPTAMELNAQRLPINVSPNVLAIPTELRYSKAVSELPILPFVQGMTPVDPRRPGLSQYPFVWVMEQLLPTARAESGKFRGESGMFLYPDTHGIERLPFAFGYGQ